MVILPNGFTAPILDESLVRGISWAAAEFWVDAGGLVCATTRLARLDLRSSAGAWPYLSPGYIGFDMKRTGSNMRGWTRAPSHAGRGWAAVCTLPVLRGRSGSAGSPSGRGFGT